MISFVLSLPSKDSICGRVGKKLVYELWIIWDELWAVSVSMDSQGHMPLGKDRTMGNSTLVLEVFLVY